MMKKDGTIFHIDFGMIFGHDYGVAASLPFTLHEQMVYVFGGKESKLFKEFVDLTVEAYSLVRKFHHPITATILMCASGRLKNLKEIYDIEYVHG